jgi:hypothetical protein
MRQQERFFMLNFNVWLSINDSMMTSSRPARGTYCTYTTMLQLITKGRTVVAVQWDSNYP